jgi:hypothetical protein
MTAKFVAPAGLDQQGRYLTRQFADTAPPPAECCTDIGADDPRDHYAAGWRWGVVCGAVLGLLAGAALAAAIHRIDNFMGGL